MDTVYLNLCYNTVPVTEVMLGFWFEAHALRYR
jgi:hypothetical protein